MGLLGSNRMMGMGARPQMSAPQQQSAAPGQDDWYAKQASVGQTGAAGRTGAMVGAMPGSPAGLAGTTMAGMAAGGGLQQSITGARNQRLQTPDAGGVVAGLPPTMNAVQQAQRSGPSADEIRAEMQRRQVGSQIGQDPRNAAIAGYMQG